MAKRVADPGPGNDANDLFPGMNLEEKPIWSGLYESVYDALFRPKLPPLELTSTPIPVVDRMAAKTNPWAVGTSTIVNAGVLAIVILLGLKAANHAFSDPARPSPIDLSKWKLPVLPNGNRSGGSGGSNDLIDPMQGRPPKIEVTPLAPPQVAIVAIPKLAVDPAIAAPPDINLPDSNLPNIGVARSPNVTLASDGPGARAGIGWRGSDGVGPGNGPGSGPGTENGIYVPGRDGVTAPVPIFAPEAEFSDEARREKYQGICLVELIVDAHGFPQNLHVVQHLGMGLDEKAMEAIRRYRFKPATKNGKPVAVAITVEVDFRLF
jgi:periplasmic protein TonB